VSGTGRLEKGPRGLAEGHDQPAPLLGVGREHHMGRLDTVRRDRGDIGAERAGPGQRRDGQGLARGDEFVDAARLFRLALEAAPAGVRLHAIGDEAVPFREIVETIGRGLDVPVTSVAPEEAADHFGWLGHFAAVDMRASGALTRKLLGRRPEHPALIPDLKSGHYFRTT
jgi:hypothetical protein